MSEWYNYQVPGELSLPELADHGKQDISTAERRQKTRHGYPRTIRGDRGDLVFSGYDLRDDRTVLRRPALLSPTSLEPDQVQQIAQDILQTSYDALGIETVQGHQSVPAP